MASTGKLTTVLGEVDPADYPGVVDAHEHLVCDISKNSPGVALQDVDGAIAEMRQFAASGGAILGEASSLGMARDPQALVRISRESGVPIVMGGGYYTAAFHPPEVADATTDELVSTMRRDLDGELSGVPAGFLGEVGTSWPFHQDEIKVLEAAFRVQRETGVMVSVHVGRDSQAPFEVVRYLEQFGGTPDRTVICHIDRTLFEIDDMLRLAATGCYVEMDLFGRDPYDYKFETPLGRLPTDEERLRNMDRLVDAGFASQLLMAQDFHKEGQWSINGGIGYGHVAKTVLPLMASLGYSTTDIELISRANPLRALGHP
jgi:phosphotriesterase-related protein